MDKRAEPCPVFDRCALYYDDYLHECGSLGDALGRSCVVHAPIDGWMRPYAGEDRRIVLPGWMRREGKPA